MRDRLFTWIALTAVAAVMLLAAGCGADATTTSLATSTASTGTTASPTSRTTAPLTTATSTTQTGAPTTAPTPSEVTVYLLRSERLAPVSRPVTGDAMEAAVQALLAGPSTGEEAEGYRTSIPEGTQLLGVEAQGDTATVDLSGSFAQGGGTLSMISRLGQLTYTLTEFEGITRVVLLLDGQAVEAIGGEGLIVSDGLTRDGFEEIAP